MSKLSIKNLDLYYSDFKALKDVNLEIEEHKITALSDLPDVESPHC